MTLKPSVGRICHYVSYGTPGGEYTSECRAAIITEVGHAEINDEGLTSLTSIRETAGLCVLNPEGMFFKRGAIYHEGDIGHDHAAAEIPQRSYPGGTWHWPERVE